MASHTRDTIRRLRRWMVEASLAEARIFERIRPGEASRDAFLPAPFPHTEAPRVVCGLHLRKRTPCCVAGMQGSRKIGNQLAVKIVARDRLDSFRRKRHLLQRRSCLCTQCHQNGIPRRRPGSRNRCGIYIGCGYVGEVVPKLTVLRRNPNRPLECAGTSPPCCLLTPCTISSIADFNLSYVRLK